MGLTCSRTQAAAGLQLCQVPDVQHAAVDDAVQQGTCWGGLGHGACSLFVRLPLVARFTLLPWAVPDMR